MKKELMGRRSALRRAINRYRDAYEADSQKGCGRLARQIEEELKRAETALKALIERYIV